MGCSLVVSPPPLPFCVSRFSPLLLAALVSFFFSSSLRPRCLRLSVDSGPGCPGPWRCVLCVFLGLPLPGSPCALASFVSPAWPWAAPSWLLPPLPLPFCVSRFSLLLLGALVFFCFFLPSVRPRFLRLSLVFGPGCPGPRRCALFALLAFRFKAHRALSPLSGFPPGRWLLPGGCCPPPPFVSRGFRRCRLVLCAVCCAVLCVPGCGAVLRSCALCCSLLCCRVLCRFVAPIWCRCLLRRAPWRCPSP